MKILTKSLSALLIAVGSFSAVTTASATPRTPRNVVLPRCQTAAKADVFRRSVEEGLKAQLFPAGRVSCRMKLRARPVQAGKIELGLATLEELFGFTVTYNNGVAEIVPLNYLIAPTVPTFACTDLFTISCTYTSQGTRAKSFKKDIEISGQAL